MHLQLAYNEAKKLVLRALEQHTEKSLFALHVSDDAQEDKDLKGVRLMLNKLYDDHYHTTNPVDDIKNVSNKYLSNNLSNT